LSTTANAWCCPAVAAGTAPAHQHKSGISVKTNLNTNLLPNDEITESQFSSGRHCDKKAITVITLAPRYPRSSKRALLRSSRFDQTTARLPAPLSQHLSQDHRVTYHLMHPVASSQELEVVTGRLKVG
jgi:hypothetical protein